MAPLKSCAGLKYRGKAPAALCKKAPSVAGIVRAASRYSFPSVGRLVIRNPVMRLPGSAVPLSNNAIAESSSEPETVKSFAVIDIDVTLFNSVNVKTNLELRREPSHDAENC